MGMRSPADSGNRGLRRGLFHLATALVLNACVLSTGVLGEEPPARVEVTLLPEVTVRGPQIRLGDLGVLRGDPTLAARAREVIVGQAPLPGRERVVELSYIHIRMRQSRLNPEHFDFLAPDRIVVRRAGRTVSPEEQIRAAEAAVRRVCNPRDGEKVIVEPLSTPLPLTVPEGELQLIADPGEGNAHAASVVAVRLRALVDGTLAATASVTVRVRRLSPVWVATRALSYGTLLAEGDARVEQRDVAGIAQPLAPNAEIVGLRVRRMLSAGSVLTASCVEATPDVHRGDTITVSLRAGAIRVRVPAKALEEGAAGGEIRVVNLTGGREYRVRVTGPGTAEAILGPGE